ncbi:MAG TPA: GNAT family N-acetyltransferase [Jatrophihabitans sp.]|nr:GNAT family N-acetyltransferase [Jatrophihabitans sp.]
MTVRIARAEPADWQQLRAVRLAGLEADPSAFGSSLERELAFTEDRWRSWPQTSTIYLACDGDRAVGIGLIRSLTDRTDPADPPEKPPPPAGEINAMWVDPELRGEGIGELLLRALLDAGRAAGYQAVRLWVTRGNDGAIRLYERCGFLPTGRTEPLLSDPQLTVLEYVLAFG